MMAKRRSALRDFMSGVLSIFSIFPPDDPPSPPPLRILSEREAMEADLQQVYKDFHQAFKRNALNQHNQRTKKEKQMTKWINTENILPNTARYVLGYFRDGQQRPARWDGYMWSDCDGAELDDPLYWTELPEPPNEEEAAKEADYQVAKRIADHLHWMLREDPDLINRLVLPKEAIDNPPTVIGLLNRMFKSNVRIVYLMDKATERVTHIYAVQEYPPPPRKSCDIHDLLA